jgi:hypothetical protein
MPTKSEWTSEVRICIDRRDAQLLVPRTVILRHGTEHFCLLQHGPRLEVRRSEPGLSDGQFTVIKEGLVEGDGVDWGAVHYLDRAALPELTARSAAGQEIAEIRKPGESP